MSASAEITIKLPKDKTEEIIDKYFIQLIGYSSQLSAYLYNPETYIPLLREQFSDWSDNFCATLSRVVLYIDPLNGIISDSGRVNGGFIATEAMAQILSREYPDKIFEEEYSDDYSFESVEDIREKLSRGIDCRSELETLPKNVDLETGYAYFRYVNGDEIYTPASCCDLCQRTRKLLLKDRNWKRFSSNEPGFLIGSKEYAEYKAVIQYYPLYKQLIKQQPYMSLWKARADVRYGNYHVVSDKHELFDYFPDYPIQVYEKRSWKSRRQYTQTISGSNRRWSLC